jgi:pimeloyl-ACP methyl ester carboxylesterase
MKLYIIPGFNENCSLKPYQELKKLAEAKGYEVNFIDVDWKNVLSDQIFDVSKDAVVFGFSLGAILGRMVAQKNPCKHLILASSSVIGSLKEGEDRKLYIDLLGKDFVDDIVTNITDKNLSKRQTTMYGDLEGEDADIIVPNTGHRLNKNYLKEIDKLL